MRVLMTFYTKLKAHEMDLENFPKAGIRISEGRTDSRVYYDAPVRDIQDIRTVMSRLRDLQCDCHSVKIFEKGKMPEMNQFGMEFNGVFYLKSVISQNKPITLSTVPYGPNEWCLMMECRKGRGLLPEAISLIPYYQSPPNEQLRLEGLA